jgi:hypothetical protein
MKNYTIHINDLINSNNITVNYIYDYIDMINYVKSIEGKTIACDIETPDFSPLNNNSRILSIGFAESDKEVTVLYTADLSDENVKNIMEIYNSLVGISVFHNKYFDRYYSLVKYGVGLKCDFDTILGVHTCLIERKLQGKGMGLKELAIDYTPFGDYEGGLEVFKTDYCKLNSITKAEFTYDLIPKELLLPYNAIDCIVTMMIYNRLQRYIPLLKEKKEWNKVEEMINLKHNVIEEYIRAKIRGVNIDKDMIYILDTEFKEKRAMYKVALEHSPDIALAVNKICRAKVREDKKKVIKKVKELKDMQSTVDVNKAKSLTNRITKAIEKLQIISSKDYLYNLVENTEFNFNSNKHKQVLFYDILKIEKKYFTKSKAPATGKLVLDNYSEQYEILKSFKQYGIYNKGIRAFLGTNNIED